MKNHSDVKGPKVTRRWGFRISATDALILILGVCLTYWLRVKALPLWWTVPFVMGHFFLFCNVFLVWQRLELLWAALFLINVGCRLALGTLDWPSPILFQLPLTILVIGLQMRSRMYHGVLADRINANLSDYLQGKI